MTKHIHPILDKLIPRNYLLVIEGYSDGPCSCETLKERTGLPLSSCYKTTTELESKGILTLDKREITKMGRKLKVYKLTISKIYLGYTQNGLVQTDLWGSQT